MIDLEEVRALYADNEPAHDFDHALRVWRLATRIGEREGADLRVLKWAALLHDIGRAEEMRTGRDHAVLSAERAKTLLRGAPKGFVQAVAEAIVSHRYRSNASPKSLEARVLFDADKLDSIGAVGVARAYLVAGLRRQRLWAPVTVDYATRSRLSGQADLDNEAHTPVHEFYFKLIKLKEMMCTVTGKKIAEERHRFMVSFFERLEKEIRGD